MFVQAAVRRNDSRSDESEEELSEGDLMQVWFQKFNCDELSRRYQALWLHIIVTWRMNKY